MSRTIEVSDETYDRIKDQLQEEIVDVSDLQDFIGKKMFFRTVTYHLLGRVVKIVGGFLQLEDASWVADSGRFMTAIKEGKLSEVEPIFVPWWVNLNSCVDFGIWDHSLPREQQ